MSDDESEEEQVSTFQDQTGQSETKEQEKELLPVDKPLFIRGNKLNKSDILRYYPFSAITIQPNNAHLQSIRILRRAVGKDVFDKDKMNLLEHNEIYYIERAMVLLKNNKELSVYLGGPSYENSLKIAKFIKEKCHKIWEKKVLDGIISDITIKELISFAAGKPGKLNNPPVDAFLY